MAHKQVRPKVLCVGMGNIGSMVVRGVVATGLADVDVVDMSTSVTQGRALDILQSCSELDRPHVKVLKSLEEVDNAECIVLTAGLPRAPGMTREDLMVHNFKVLQSIVPLLKKRCPEAFLIVVTNPLDVMVWAAHYAFEWPKDRLIGMAGMLDAQRLCFFLSQAIDVAVGQISSVVLGAHNDYMVPLASSTTIAGIPLLHWLGCGYLTEDVWDTVVSKTRSAGGDIVALLGNGSAFQGPAAIIVKMLRMVLSPQAHVIVGSVPLSSRYGLGDVCAGLPVLIHQRRIQQVIDLPLDPFEAAAFQASLQSVRSSIDTLQQRLSQQLEAKE